ncbi:MAG: M36 family metallopeptidase [Actinomycetota bacterium]|nr:M36 family metallopeptidase [Actinomycetota bacterium]
MVDYDEATRLPNFVASREPAARLSTAPADSPEDAVTQFIQDRGDLWNLTPEDGSTVDVISVSRKGLNTVNLIQRVEGREVFNSDVTAAVSPDNEVISVSGQLFPGAAAASQGAMAATTTSEEEAIAKAALDLTNIAYEATDFSLAEAEVDSGQYRFYQFTPQEEEDPRPTFERPARVKDVMFPLGEGQFTPAYYMELWIEGFPAFAYVVDAVDTPDVLFRKNLTDAVEFRYRVFNTRDNVSRPEDSPAPGTQHPTGAPDGFQAPTINEKVVHMESLLDGDPWLPPDAETTDGNNCIAYADLQFPNGLGAGDILGRVKSQRFFNYKYNHSKPATDPENLQSTLVGMFFHVNWLHDRWYEAGFDEASGNAQKDNFGRGGLGGDPILAEGNDFSGTNNANMNTPADGSSPRMQMFVFPGASPSRTSNFEALITFHEMGHYITNRLIGNGSGLINVQGRSMGEGWGDFFAICMTSQNTDDFAGGVFAAGGWVLLNITPGFSDNYYFGIRRYPYTADMTKNPLTFRHISNGVVLPIGPPITTSGIPSSANNEVHNAGEVWCSALWEVFVNLVGKHQHEEAEKRMLTYVIGGLKLTPPSPTFTQARDGIITAVSALNPGDLPEVWAGFAKRGMGVGAVSPPATSTSLAGVVESFTVPP